MICIFIESTLCFMLDILQDTLYTNCESRVSNGNHENFYFRKYTNYLICRKQIQILLARPGVARGKKVLKKKKMNKNNFRFFQPDIPRPPMSVHKKIQPNRSSRLAGYTQHIYTNVLFYYIVCYISCNLGIGRVGKN